MSGDILSKHLQLLSPKGAILKLRHLDLAMLAMVIAQQLWIDVHWGQVVHHLFPKQMGKWNLTVYLHVIYLWLQWII